MIPFTFSSHRPLRSLPRLLKAYNARGGSIVEYKRVLSCFVFSRKGSHYVWVPPNANRTISSLPDTILTLLFGWWSIHGLFWTIEVLFTNLAGGRDATKELLKATCGGDVALAEAVIDEEVKEGRRQSVRAILQFVGIIGAVVVVFGGLIKITEWYIGRADAVRARERQVAKANVAGYSRVDRTLNTSPGEMRLQAIFYDPHGRSTAIINRATVSVGARAGVYTVLAIEPQSVALQDAKGEKLVLQMAARN